MFEFQLSALPGYRRLQAVQYTNIRLFLSVSIVTAGCALYFNLFLLSPACV